MCIRDGCGAEPTRCGAVRACACARRRCGGPAGVARDGLGWAALCPLRPGLLRTGVAGRSGEPWRLTLSAWRAGGITLAALALLVRMAPEVFAGHTLLLHVDWVPDIGLHLGFRLDGLALMFALLIAAISSPENARCIVV